MSVSNVTCCSRPSDPAAMQDLLDLAAAALAAFPATNPDARATFDLLFFWRRLLPAFELAGKHHAIQTDKAGELKLWHVLRVCASLLPDVDAAVVGALHDLLEDTGCSLEECVERCHLTSIQAGALLLLTHHPALSYEDYIQNIQSLSLEHPDAAMARKVKLADLADNLNPRRQALAEAKAGIEAMAPLRARYAAALQVLDFSKKAND